MPKYPKSYRDTPERDLVYQKLLAATRSGGTVRYKEIGEIIGVRWERNYSNYSRQLGIVLGEISEDELNEGRPMLSSIAVDTGGKTSNGFFNWAEKLGQLQDNSEAGRWHFLRETRQAVYKTWTDN